MKDNFITNIIHIALCLDLENEIFEAFNRIPEEKLSYEV